MNSLVKPRWRRLSSRGLLFVAVLLFLVPGVVHADDLTESQRALLREVMPGADSFSDKEGDPPVFRAYRTGPDGGEQTLLGYAFLTSDVPPEVTGYSGRIEVLVGMDLEGTLTGVQVVRYREAIARILGDFFRRPGFQEQFAGKSIADPFRVGRDVDSITRATISVDAMARGVRNAARRVAEAYLREPEPPPLPDERTGADASPLERLELMSWPDLLSSGIVTKVVVRGEDQADLDLSFSYIGNEAMGRFLLGPGTYARARKEAGARYPDRHLMLVGLEGRSLLFFTPQKLAVRQGTETLPFSSWDLIPLGEPEEGMIAGQVAEVGVLLMDQAVDMGQPFTILYDLRPDRGLFSGEYSLPVGLLAMTQEDPAPDLAPAEEPAPASAPAGQTAPVSVPASQTEPGSAPTGKVAPALTFSFAEEDTVVSRLFTGVSWTRVAALLALFGLIMYAFLRKSTRARWVALAYTLVYVGFVDGSFLSISHITSGIKVGPSLYLNDLPLLLIVGFTATTSVLWGRVFCGFLCPFGALQEFLGRAVPRRFQRIMPQRVHDRALYIKYGILALILALALVQSDVGVFQYFEPFGTVFFLSPSIVLWSILVGILIASAVIPQFYCRYVCPLGAALGLASLLTLFRIKRVDQCGICKVCEQACPTAAIRGPKIDFKECTRCNICEIKLMTRAGVCRHSMEMVRDRLKSRKPVPQH